MHHPWQWPFTPWSLSDENKVLYEWMIVCLSQEQLDYLTKLIIHTKIKMLKLLNYQFDCYYTATFNNTSASTLYCLLIPHSLHTLCMELKFILPKYALHDNKLQQPIMKIINPTCSSKQVYMRCTFIHPVGFMIL